MGRGRPGGDRAERRPSLRWGGGIEVVRPPLSDSRTPCSRPGLVLPCPPRRRSSGAGSGRAQGARSALKRRTKAAPERAQVVASGRGAGPNDPPRGAGDRPVLCPGAGGGPGCPPGGAVAQVHRPRRGSP